jgi:type I restriction enzyme, S subunit
MELMNRYKQTELGVIPEDWKLLSIDQIFEFHSTSNYSKSQMLVDGEIGCFHYGLIHSLPNFNYDIRNGVRYYVTEKQAKYEFIKDGDIVMVDASEDLSGVNKSIEVSGVQDKLFISGLHTYLLRDKGYFVDGFRGLVLNSYKSKAQFYRLAVGMKVFGVSKKQLKTVILPIPSKKEQIAIAAALSDADAYITSLEKLIEKKKAIKHGVMQELLKPTDGWESKKLGEIGKTFGGLSGKSKKDFNEGRFPFIPFMNVMSNPIIDIQFFNYVNVANGESQNLVLKGDLLFNGSSETPEELGMCSILLNEIPFLYLNSFCFGFRLKKETQINGLYLSYYFRSKEGRKLFFSMAQGATRYNLSKANFNNLFIKLPSVKEQDKISKILYDIDQELKTLEKKLLKVKNLKLGMMQNLLTGKIRLT